MENKMVIKKVEIGEAHAAYSAGKMSRTELESATGLWFGDVLLELGKRNLPLPRFDPSVQYTPEQKELHEKLFGFDEASDDQIVQNDHIP
ncbi:MAG: hypothetical protein ACYC4K_03550 [Thiobacillus sp.]